MSSEFEILRAEHESALKDLEKMFEGKTIDFTRPLNEYPTKEKIVEFIKLNPATQHVHTETLQGSGRLVQDDMEKYLANEALSSSMLKAALKTPMHFEFAKSEDKEKLDEIKGEKGYFNIGTFLHQCLLEPTKFSRVIVEPKYNRASKDSIEIGIKFYENIIEKQEKGLLIHEEEGKYTTSEAAPHLVFEVLNERITAAGLKPDSLEYKKRYLECIIEAADVYALTEENELKVRILKRHIDNYAGGIIYRLLKHSKREISAYWTDANGMRFKVRPDSIQFKENIGANAIISVKSTACEDLNAFFAQAAKLNYDLTEGMYQEVVSAATGRDFNTTITIMLQTVAPYAVAVMVWKPEDIEMGKHKYRVAVDNAMQIMETGSVKGYDAYAEEGCLGLIDMSLPGWNQREIPPQNI